LNFLGLLAQEPCNMGFFHAALSHAVSAVMLHLHPGYHLCNRTWVPFTI